MSKLAELKAKRAELDTKWLRAHQSYFHNPLSSRPGTLRGIMDDIEDTDLQIAELEDAVRDSHLALIVPMSMAERLTYEETLSRYEQKVLNLR